MRITELLVYRFVQLFGWVAWKSVKTNVLSTRVESIWGLLS
jgi:hypothetical protein